MKEKRKIETLADNKGNWKVCLMIELEVDDIFRMYEYSFEDPTKVYEPEGSGTNMWRATSEPWEAEDEDGDMHTNIDVEHYCQAQLDAWVKSEAE